MPRPRKVYNPDQFNNLNPFGEGVLYVPKELRLKKRNGEIISVPTLTGAGGLSTRMGRKSLRLIVNDKKFKFTPFII